MTSKLNRRNFLAVSATAAAASLAAPVRAQSSAASPPSPPSPPLPQSPNGAAAGNRAIIRLSANENPYGPSPLARAAINASADEACRYGMEPLGLLTRKLASREGVDKERIVVGAGSGELLNMLALAYCADRQLVCAWPTFEQLPGYAEKLGAQLRKIPLDADLRHDLPALASAVTADTALLYVCNPNNPTGTAVTGPQLRAFCTDVARRTLIAVDEAYLDLIEPGATESMVDLVRADHNVVVLRTFSKIHGLAGLRVGYAVAPPAVAAKLRRLQMTIQNVTGLRAAIASLDDAKFLAETARSIAADRARVIRACGALGLRCASAQGNFVFVNVGMPVETFRARLHARGIDVGRPFEPYREWCRITIGTGAETDALLAALPQALEG